MIHRCEVMKKMESHVKYILAAALLPFVWSCEIYNDRDELQEPAYMVVQPVYGAYVYEMFKAAELSYFFQQYQEIREDREAAVSFATEYFGMERNWDYCLFYEEAEISGIGRILLNDDGSFTVDPSITFYRFFPSVGTFTVTSEAPGRFIISSDAADGLPAGSVVSSVLCDDGYVTLEDFSLSLDTGEFRLDVVSVDGEPVKKLVAPDSIESYQAVSGSLSFIYKEYDGFEDEFELGFGEDCVTVSRGSSSVKCKPLDRYEKNYDYVIG